jgi:hypothetical protein
MAVWLVNGIVLVLTIALVVLAIGSGQIPGHMMLLLLTLAFASVTFWFTMTAYRVGGGRNLIRFHADRVEVPGPAKRQPIVFPREGTQITIRDVMVNYRFGLASVGSVRRGRLIELRHGDVRRKISTLTLAEEIDEEPLLADLRLFMTGEAAIGRAGHTAPAPRTNYDDRLDRELAQLD